MKLVTLPQFVLGGDKRALGINQTAAKDCDSLLLTTFLDRIDGLRNIFARLFIFRRNAALGSKFDSVSQSITANAFIASCRAYGAMLRDHREIPANGGIRILISMLIRQNTTLSMVCYDSNSSYNSDQIRLSSGYSRESLPCVIRTIYGCTRILFRAAHRC